MEIHLKAKKYQKWKGSWSSSFSLPPNALSLGTQSQICHLITLSKLITQIIHSFNKYLLSFFNVSGTAPVLMETDINQIFIQTNVKLQ